MRVSQLRGARVRKNAYGRSLWSYANNGGGMNAHQLNQTILAHIVMMCDKMEELDPGNTTDDSDVVVFEHGK